MLLSVLLHFVFVLERLNIQQVQYPTLMTVRRGDKKNKKKIISIFSQWRHHA